MQKLRLPKGFIAVCVLLAWFNWGSEDIRNGSLDALKEHPLGIFVPPWLPLRAYVTHSKNDDDHLYWEYTRLTLGEEADVDYLAHKRQGDPERNYFEIAAQIRDGPGLRLPYRDFPFEYPPLALGLMLLPRAFATRFRRIASPSA